MQRGDQSVTREKSESLDLQRRIHTGALGARTPSEIRLLIIFASQCTDIHVDRWTDGSGRSRAFAYYSIGYIPRAAI